MTKPKEIVYRHTMDRPPTMDDRMKKVGLDGLANRLKGAGWVAEDGETVLRNFDVVYEGVAEPNNNYIEWRATLRLN